MKTKLFSLWDPFAKPNEKFVPDIQFISDINIETLMQLTEHIAAFHTARNTTENRIIAEKMATQYNLPPVQIARIMNIFCFMAGEMLPGEDAAQDTPFDLAQDMVELKVIPADKMEHTKKWLEKIQTISNKSLHGFRCRETLTSTLPLVRLIETKVDMRVVFDREFNSSKEEIEKYDPKCIGVEPIAILRFVLTGSAKENFCFQAEQRSLNLIIHSLQSVQKEIDVATKFLKLKKLEEKNS